MQIATKEFLENLDTLAAARREEIRKTPDLIAVTGTRYYVTADGNDEADGKSPATAWKTPEKVSKAALMPGDGVFFRRGDIFRGTVYCKSGVTYAAFGEGEKPRFYSWHRDLADPALWELYDEAANIWHLRERITETGNLIFDGGREHAYKHIPSITKDGTYVVRDTDIPFVMQKEMTHDLDLYCLYVGGKFMTKPSKGEDFPIPDFYEDSVSELYLRSNRGNPGYVFSSIEAAVRVAGFRIPHTVNDVTIDNLCLMYYGIHAISAGGERVRGLHVTNCEIGWIGGTVQSYSGTDPNHPQGIRGEVTRFGNGVEIYGGCDDYLVENCYVYECYDAGLTHQVTTIGFTREMTNVVYRNNLIENCVYGIEYFLEMREGDTESYMDNILMEGNFIRHSGEGWGQQRHNTHTPAHIKGWSYENVARHYTIRDNILDRAGRRSVHLVADRQEYCPLMEGNTYIQYDGGSLGKYGGKEEGEPCDLYFDGAIEDTIRDVLGDKTAKVYTVKK
ncbi:MAG: hypothetical protein J6T24_09835 [Clostridia bacterium]|nr:hypothetical protein [Clostridia bacterium]